MRCSQMDTLETSELVPCWDRCEKPRGAQKLRVKQEAQEQRAAKHPASVHRRGALLHDLEFLSSDPLEGFERHHHSLIRTMELQ